MKNKFLTQVAMGLMFFGLTATVNAALITFNSFPEGFPAGFSFGSEDGFTITGTNAGIWSNSFGFPTASAGATSGNTLVEFSFSTVGQFQFNDFDIVNPFGGALPSIFVSGFVGTTLISQDIFSSPLVAGTPTNFVASNLAGQNIDSLVISFTSGVSQTQLIDNIALSSSASVPAPAAVWLFGFGLIGLIGARKKSVKLLSNYA